jgi:Ran GTPase-activating protein (RanGAP) involved in mRNA processing and transport
MMDASADRARAERAPPPPRRAAPPARAAAAPRRRPREAFTPGSSRRCCRPGPGHRRDPPAAVWWLPPHRCFPTRPTDAAPAPRETGRREFGAMEPEPEDEEQAAAAAAAEAPDESAVLAARVKIAGHEVDANSTALDVSGWKLTAVQVREVAGVLPQLLCLQELVLDDEVPVSGATPRGGDFKYGAETVDVDLATFRALCEALRACQSLTSLSLKKCYLGPQALALLAGLIKVIAVLKKVVLSQNFVFGSKYNSRVGRTIHTVDADQSGWSALCDALPGSPVEELIAVDIGMGLNGVTSLAKAMTAGAALAVVNVVGNAIGEPGARTLIEAFNGNSKIQSLLGINPGSTSADFSKTSMQPHDCIILAHELNASRAAAALASLTVSGNPLTGATCDLHGNWSNIDSNMSGFVALCAVLGKLTEVNLSDCHLGPTSTGELAKVFSDAEAVLEVLAVGDNPIGSEGGSALVAAVKTSNLKIIDIGKPLPVQEPYESQTLDVSQTGMGPGQVVILSWWLTTPFSAALARVSVLSNPIGADGADALIQVFNQNTKLRTLLGIEEGVTELNLSKKNVDPGQAKILAAELKASRAVAAVKKVALSNNFIFGSKDSDPGMPWNKTIHDVDADQSGWSALCAALPASPVEELDVADVGMGVTGVTSLAKAISSMAAVKKVVLSQNFLFGSKLEFGAFGDTVHDIDADQSGWSALCGALPSSAVQEFIVADVGIGVTGVTSLAKAISSMAAIEKVNVSGWLRHCTEMPEAAAQLLTAANEASRARLRAHQVLAFSEALHARLGSECLLQAVALDTDVWRRVAENVRERHGHELMCARLAQPCSRAWLRVRQVLAFSKIVHARLGSECLLQVMEIDADVWRQVAENVHKRHGHEAICSRLAQPWFEVTVEGLIPEGIPTPEQDD